MQNLHSLLITTRETHQVIGGEERGHWVCMMPVATYPFAIDPRAIILSFRGQERVLFESQQEIWDTSAGQNNCYTQDHFIDALWKSQITIIDQHGRYSASLCDCISTPGESKPLPG